ncbi:hypothetical protein GC244_14620, partial [Staphylococcus aureus]|uniref:hypothetical protein n=1 Tax=Staphylococcus aureus TaxID=1280 RepID=UPI001367CEB7|nr:hypothetical protein [Staphylococcus aureus]
LPADEFGEGKNDPKFKDKIQIAMDMFDAASNAFDFSAIAFDTWYASQRFLEHIHAKKKYFFSEIKASSHHVAFATPRNDENGFIAISCCSICT